MGDESNSQDALRFLNEAIAAENECWDLDSSFEDILAYLDNSKPGWREAYEKRSTTDKVPDPEEPNPQDLADLVMAETGGLTREGRGEDPFVMSLSNAYIESLENKRRSLNAIGKSLAMSHESYPSNMGPSREGRPVARPTKEELKRYKEIWGQGQEEKNW